MAILDNSIGPHEFIALLGQRIIPRQLVMLDSRPGVVGTEITLAALKGEPFRLLSQVDAADYDTAWALHRSYLTTIGGGPQVLVQAGISSLTEANYAVQVINVWPGRILPIKNAVGFKKGAAPNEGFCECEWELIAVPLA